MSAPVELLAPEPAGASGILTPEALAFVADLHTHFASRRDELLARRAQRAAAIAEGAQLGFLPETASIRSSDWSVAPAPADLNDRRCEITGPVDRKMMINALNSGARCFMADFEDASSPTWENVVQGHLNVRDALRGKLSLDT